MSKVAVYIEMKEGEVRKQVFEVLTFAHRGGSDVCGIVLEGDAEGCKGSLEEYGVSSIIQVKSNALANYDPGVYADAAIAALKHSGADSLLALTSAQGKDLLPRIAAKLKLPLIMDATVVNVAESSVVKSHFSGRANAEISLSGDLKLFGVRPNSVDPEAKAANATVESIDVDLSSDRRVVLKEVVKKEKLGKVELTEAKIIMSGGRAIGSAENFSMIFECAKHIGAAVGASRAAVDSGYAPHEMQVGQTGKTVSPNVYIACGISGAVQHFAGMKTSKVIVAINKNPDAPIFNKCDYGIVGDIFDVVPELSKVFQELS